MEGERVAEGVAHADNVSPALIGGFTLVRDTNPLDVISIPFPSELAVAVCIPLIEVRTEDARKVLKKNISLGSAVKQFGNIAGLIAGLHQSDMNLIGRSLTDVIIEPERAILVPGFKKVQVAAIHAGALGAGLSGSGPTIFALCRESTVASVENAMHVAFLEEGIKTLHFGTKISNEGCRVIP